MKAGQVSAAGTAVTGCPQSAEPDTLFKNVRGKPQGRDLITRDRCRRRGAAQLPKANSALLRPIFHGPVRYCLFFVR